MALQQFGQRPFTTQAQQLLAMERTAERLLLLLEGLNHQLAQQAQVAEGMGGGVVARLLQWPTRKGQLLGHRPAHPQQQSRSRGIRL